MTMDPLTPSIESRERNPYGSLYAALLFHSFRDAVSEAMEPDTSSSGSRTATLDRKRPSLRQNGEADTRRERGPASCRPAA